jgi:hypothetical protein
MFAGIGDLLFHPDVFFSRISEERSNIFPPLVIVGTAGLISSFSCVINCYLKGNCADTATILFMAGWLFALSFVMWLILSGLLFVISRLFAGKGSITATFQNTGYGMLPQVFINPVIIAGMLLFYRNSPGIYASVWETPMIFSFFVYLVFYLWGGYIWIFAIKNTHDISLKRSVAAVFLSGMILLIIFMYNPLPL